MVYHAARSVMHTVSLNQLELQLWEAANILRGPVDAADFKSYVFPLLFFKRISDVHDEEHQAALTESGGDEEYAQFPQNYRFQIPDDCHWEDVRTVATNVGQALQKAMRGIEKANPETLGIFDDVARALDFDEKAVQQVVSNIEELRKALPVQVQQCLAFFPGVDRNLGGYEGLMAAQQCLPNNEARDKFAANYIVLGTSWEALSPDPCLSQYEKDYRWLAQVYESVKPP